MPKRCSTETTILTRMSSKEDLERRIAIPCCWLALVFLLFLSKAGTSQNSQNVQFLPEIDAYLKLNPHIRVSAQAKDTREGGDVDPGGDRPEHGVLLEAPDQAEGNHLIRSG